MRIALFAVLFAFAFAAAGIADDTATPAHVSVELPFTAAVAHNDPFNTVELDAVFTAPDGRQIKVPAFWAGGDQWRVRFASPTPGVYTYRTACSDPDDAGLHGRTGTIRVQPYDGDNPLFRHGPIRIAADRRHFEHADNRPFLWIGDTQWMSLCQRIAWPDEFQQLVNDRRDKGFNVIQIVAGPYPDQGPFDPRGFNEAGYSWSAEFGSINPAYYDAADRRIRYIIEQGITPCIVGMWGYYMPTMGEAKIRKHWRYLIARYGSMPVAWCIAGEANLPWYLAPGFPFDDREQVKQWTNVARYVRSIEPFGRPISIHPTGLGAMTARTGVDDASLIDFDMLQTGHGDRAALGPTVRVMRSSYAAGPRMPVLNSEVCYEGILGGCDASVQRLMLWASLLSGGCGHTYGANGIWQLNGRDTPYGKSPHGGDYGHIPWQDAMKLPGSTQVPLAAKLLGRYEWWRLEPNDGAASIERIDVPRSGRWVWSTPDARRDAPIAKRYFRRTFELPAEAKVVLAVVRVACDDRSAVYFNGHRLGETRDWSHPSDLRVDPSLIKGGRNVIAIEGENLPAPVKENPAGLLVDAMVQFADGSTRTIGSDAKWRVADEAGADWTAIEFDDAAWPAAAELAERGDGPWGAIGDSASSGVGPFAAQTADGSLRIVYLPTGAPVRLTKLNAGVEYAATWFDPITGGSRPGAVTVDPGGARGALVTIPPSEQDWVLVVESRGR